MADGGAEGINSAAEKLTRASHAIAEQLYKAQAAAGAAAGGGAGGPGGPGGPGAGPRDGGGAAGADSGSGGAKQSDVVDAEFVDVDETKQPN